MRYVVFSDVAKKRRIEWWDARRRYLMRKSIPLAVVAALIFTPAAFAQSQGQSNGSGQGYKPSAETPAQQKERNKDYSKVPGAPGNKSGPPAQKSR
jgi:hypothetical protein